MRSKEYAKLVHLLALLSTMQRAIGLERANRKHLLKILLISAEQRDAHYREDDVKNQSEGKVDVNEGWPNNER